MPFDGIDTPFNYLEKFDQAAKLVATPNQWIKHSYNTPWGGHCLKEALNVVGIAEIFEPVILKAAEEVMDREFCCIESFNDHPLTTHNDVLTVLRRVRARIVGGAVEVPVQGAVVPTRRWNEHRSPTRESWAVGLWQKLFCWS